MTEMDRGLTPSNDRAEGADGGGTGTGVEGPWTIWKDNSGTGIAASIAGPPCDEVPVVPCDSAAVQRVADELRSMLGDVPLDFRELAEMALRAAGEVAS